MQSHWTNVKLRLLKYSAMAKPWWTSNMFGWCFLIYGVHIATIDLNVIRTFMYGTITVRTITFRKIQLWRSPQSHPRHYHIRAVFWCWWRGLNLRDVHLIRQARSPNRERRVFLLSKPVFYALVQIFRLWIDDCRSRNERQYFLAGASSARCTSHKSIARTLYWQLLNAQCVHLDE